jgi:hypothetical protein
MKWIRAAMVATSFALSCFQIPAHATAFGTDQSDLWYVPTESGWGMQLVQRGPLIFATIFIYGQSGEPTWYVATLNPGAALTWSGPLYASNGPWFGTTPFNPALVSQSPVGSMTWVATFVQDGILTYSVNGVVVTKNMTRETIAGDTFAGTFAGGLHSNVSGCASASLNGQNEQAGGIVVTQNGTSIGMRTIRATDGSICTYSGTAGESGQMGQANGSFSCSDGSAGFFNFFEMQVNPWALSGRFQLNYSTPAGCQASGWFGGARSTLLTF